MAKAIIDALSKFPEGAVKTITCDRGSEFACWREIEKSPFYCKRVSRFDYRQSEIATFYKSESRSLSCSFFCPFFARFASLTFSPIMN